MNQLKIWCKSFVRIAFEIFLPLKAMENDPDQCPRCKGKVFPAEMVTMKTGHFHKKCFSCCNCKRVLDVSNACDGPNKGYFLSGDSGSIRIPNIFVQPKLFFFSLWQQNLVQSLSTWVWLTNGWCRYIKS